MKELEVAEAILKACLDAAVAAYEEAGIQGLCAEGRWEVAVGAVRSLDVRRLVSGMAEESPRDED
jgi:hypothetical protein